MTGHLEHQLARATRGRLRTRVVLSAASLAVLAAFAAPAHAKSYSAERFDSTVRILPGGAIEVTETVVFRFEDGTFRHVYRDLRTRHTDGIEIVSASMDGRVLPFGEGDGQVEVSGDDRIRVRWRFEPVADSTHTFVLNYVVRGAVRRDGAVDVLHWRALPSDHDYRIAESRVRIEHPGATPAARPQVEARRSETASVEPLAGGLIVAASDIRRNGWVEVRVPFAAGTYAASPPAWQARAMRQAELGPRWLAAAGVVLAGALIVLFAVRQRYDSPPRDLSGSSPAHDAPDDLAPASAGALVANGSVSLEHAMAALFHLADRGEITIVEEPRGSFGVRRFTVKRIGRKRPLAAYEEALLDTMFRERHGTVDAVSLSKARSRLAHRMKAFSTAVKADLAARGLLDPDRRRVRDLFARVAVALLLLAGVALAGGLILVNEYGPWPLAIGGALLVASLVGFILQSATSPLSNEGVRRAERWRAYRRHLNDVAQSRVHASASPTSGALALAVAMGLAAAWSKFLKRQPETAPAWFHAVSAADDGGFAAFVAVGGAGATSGGAGGAGAAAGGGGSGAG
jgi:hypothetical protein